MTTRFLKMLYSAACKKGLSDSPGLVDSEIGLVNLALNLPDGQVKFFQKSNYRGTVTQIKNS